RSPRGSGHRDGALHAIGVDVVLAEELEPAALRRGERDGLGAALLDVLADVQRGDREVVLDAALVRDSHLYGLAGRGLDRVGAEREVLGRELYRRARAARSTRAGRCRGALLAAA